MWNYSLWQCKCNQMHKNWRIQVLVHLRHFRARSPPVTPARALDPKVLTLPALREAALADPGWAGGEAAIGALTPTPQMLAGCESTRCAIVTPWRPFPKGAGSRYTMGRAAGVPRNPGNYFLDKISEFNCSQAEVQPTGTSFHKR